MNRRSFIFGASASLIAAPAIVRAASLMPIRGIVMPVSAESLMRTHGELEIAYGRLDLRRLWIEWARNYGDPLRLGEIVRVAREPDGLLAP